MFISTIVYKSIRDILINFIIYSYVYIIKYILQVIFAFKVFKRKIFKYKSQYQLKSENNTLNII